MYLYKRQFPISPGKTARFPYPFSWENPIALGGAVWYNSMFQKIKEKEAV